MAKDRFPAQTCISVKLCIGRHRETETERQGGVGRKASSKCAGGVGGAFRAQGLVGDIMAGEGPEEEGHT